jgi:hypothetical protein
VADSTRTGTRPLLLVGAGTVVIVLVTIARGPVALLAVASVAVLTGIVLAVPPLLKPDGIDWDWLPDRAVEVPAEPGIANLRRLLAPEPGDTAAPRQLQELVRAVAEDRAPDRSYGRGRLAAYLNAAPRLLDLAEADAVITELEALPLQETP